MQDWTDLMAELPGGALLAVIFAILIGLVLWSLGRRVLRGAFAVVGLIAGGAAGWLLTVALLPDTVPAWAGALALGALAAILAFVLYRAAMAVLLALTFAAASVAAVTTWIDVAGPDAFDLPPAEDRALVEDELRSRLGELRDATEEERDALERDIERLREILDLPGDLEDASGDDVAESPEEPPTWLVKARERTQAEAAAWRERWDQAPPGVKWSVGIGAICGAILGLLVGLASPTWGASIVTALVGAALWMAGGWILLTRFGEAGDTPAWIPSTPERWLPVWVLAAAVGVAIQWITRPRTADKSQT